VQEEEEEEEEEEGNTATSTSSTTEASTTRAQSAEVVVDAEEVVDLTQSPSASRRKRKQKNSTKLSQSNDGDDDDDPHDELQRLTRIAKKFKRQFLQKNLQYKEQYNEKRKLSERVRQVDEELLEMQSGMKEIERNQDMTILHLKESRLSLQRTLTERDILKSKYTMMEKLKSKVDSQLKKCHSHYEKELENARTTSMSEGMYVCMYIYIYILFTHAHTHTHTHTHTQILCLNVFLLSITNSIILLFVIDSNLQNQ